MDTITINSGKPLQSNPGDIIFTVGGNNVLTLKHNGDILVKGKLIENDREVIEGLREFIDLSREERGRRNGNYI
ncbi:hypothetical protein [Bacillus paranthracis]|uniref:Uncharacterized protein n=1 Tax=Bacillus paranthracis TaxID=2026186 RepID=A0AAJ1K6S3_9BACI|nr:hypothetical protein [Bacillus paranthracis]MDG0950512.1 hypothetical protein [Bacillus paranthracis]MDG0955762.1 hypothetical protein [Bacillus paranthracis]